MARYVATVVIDTDSIEHAEQAINERVSFDEDYGFPYQFVTTEVKEA